MGACRADARFSHAAPRGAAPRTLLGGSAWDSNANCSMAAARHPTPEAKRRNAKPRRNWPAAIQPLPLRF